MRLSVAIRRLRAHSVLGLAVALLAFLLAFFLRYSFGDELYTVPFITLFPAILISALVGGVWVGVLVALLSALAAWFWFLPPSATFALSWPEGYLIWALFALTCFIQLYVIHALNRTVDTLDQTVNELTHARDRSAALFQELQHRVANNLQFVAAMLRMKRQVLELDPSAGDRLFESAQSRLDMMARIHRRLYSPDATRQPIREFIQGLCDDILASRGAQNVNCVVKAPQITFDLEQLVALGLLVNELVTNSIKHAFIDGKTGTISITLEENAGTQVELTVKDDGNGLPRGIDLVNGGSLGGQIMHSLAVQLGGELLWIEQQQGTAARLAFPMSGRGTEAPSPPG
jgi:two-component sensor histidine kinase